MEKHLEALLAQSAGTGGTNSVSNGTAPTGNLRSSISTNAHGTSANEHTGLAPSAEKEKEKGQGQGEAKAAVPYGIQYQNRDGGESVVWGNAGNGGGGGAASGLAGLGDEDLEEKALGMAIEETWEESGRRWRPWAANGRATRVGEFVLIVDSDTVVPEDCLRDAAREMRACPTVAIIQHESGAFLRSSFFVGVIHFLIWLFGQMLCRLRIITLRTVSRISRGVSTDVYRFVSLPSSFLRRCSAPERLNNNSYTIACANGEVAPFMGHNA